MARSRRVVFMVGAERAARERKAPEPKDCVRFAHGEASHAATPVVDEWQKRRKEIVDARRNPAVPNSARPPSPSRAGRGQVDEATGRRTLIRVLGERSYEGKRRPPHSRRTRLRGEIHVLGERGYEEGRRAEGNGGPLISVLGERSYGENADLRVLANAATGGATG